jgi:tetratricopeptide (TPR) repeat protein/uncharacterized caspase-like protein
MRSSWITLATLIAGLLGGLAGAAPGAAQQGPATGRGFGKVKAAAAAPAGTRRAVIVGISHYKNVASLSYAAADASSFAQFLQSSAGGSVPAASIRLLLDTAATRVPILDAVSWLWEVSKPGDEAIIYFAGHGDIETGHSDRGSKDDAGPSDASAKDVLDMGFLLTYDARPDRHYIAEGAINSMDLLRLIGQIVKREATVWLITDACRSGNLINGPVDDSRAIAPLMRDWMGVASLVSSGPDQLSQEGRQWGGGHGVFTYYLLRGLAGSANTDSDQVVTLEEAARFVQDSVKAATHGLQVPQRSGNLGRVAAWVPQVQTLAATGGGHEDAVAARGLGAPAPDSAVLRAMARLSDAVRRGALLKPEGNNAWEIYLELAADPAAADVLADARSDLKTAFQLDAQQVITDFMAGGARQPDAPRIRDAATELGHAADLMGKLALMAPTLAAQRLFLDGYAYIQKGDFDAALKSLRQTVVEEPQGYSFSALGLALLATGQLDSARQAFAKATVRAPHRPTPLLGQAFVSLEAGDAAGALQSLDTAVAFTEPQASLELARALVLLQLGLRREAVAAYRRAEVIDPQVKDDRYARDLLPYTAMRGDRLARLRLALR